jgi:hypothetical protein
MENSCSHGIGPQRNGTGGEIEIWVSTNEGFDWIKESELTSGSRWNNSYPRRPMNVNREFFTFWVDGDVTKLSPSQLYFTNEKCDRIWVLPYKMKKDFERPVRIK